MKKIKWIILLFLIGLTFFQIFRSHMVTVYLTVGKTNGEALERQVKLVINDQILFQDSLQNNIFVAEIIKKELNTGFHSLEVYSNGANIVAQSSFFVLFDQHLVLEYFDDCVEDKPCYAVRNKLRKHYID